MAEFVRETAIIEEVYLRKLLPNGDSEYIPQPYNIVKYDDGGTYLEPENSPLAPFQRGDYANAATASVFRIIDNDAFVDPDTGFIANGIKG